MNPSDKAAANLASSDPTCDAIEPVPASRRSPMERTIVWGILGLLAALTANEWRATQLFQQRLGRLSTELERAESERRLLTASDVARLLDGISPSSSQPAEQLSFAATRVDLYRMPSLKSRRIYVYYGHGDDPPVLSVTTDPELTWFEKYPPFTPEELAAQQREFAASLEKRDAELRAEAAAYLKAKTKSADEKK